MSVSKEIETVWDRYPKMCTTAVSLTAVYALAAATSFAPMMYGRPDVPVATQPIHERHCKSGYSEVNPEGPAEKAAVFYARAGSCVLAAINWPASRILSKPD